MDKTAFNKRDRDSICSRGKEILTQLRRGCMISKCVRIVCLIITKTMIFSSHKSEYGALGSVKGRLQYPTLCAKNNDHFSSERLLTDHGIGNWIRNGYRLTVGRCTIFLK